MRSPGGGAITAVAAARLGLDTALVAPVGDDLGGQYVRREVEADGVTVAGFRTKRTPETVVMPVGRAADDGHRRPRHPRPREPTSRR